MRHRPGIGDIMSGLVLKLRPAERVMINGAVIENGDRRSRLNILTPRANVLRLRDAIHPEEATTPVKRVCYTAQMVLAGETTQDDGHKQLSTELAQLAQVFTDSESTRILAEVSGFLAEKNDYQVLKALRLLLPIEEKLMAGAPCISQ